MTTAARVDAAIDGVSAQVYEIPTDAPEADGTLPWSSTTLVLAEVAAGGLRGIGYTYGDGACGKLINGPLAGTLTGHNAVDIPARWEAMVRAMRNNGRPGLVSCAISAIDTALWDLKGKLLGLPVCRLLGMAHAEVPIYGSGGFTTYDERTTRAQLERWVDEWGIPRVKIKIGESWGADVTRDLDRITLARKVIGPDTELYVDANGGYRRKQAIRVAHAMADHGVTWFEEPVSSDDLAGLREVRDQVTPDVTAGEYGYDLAYFNRMLAAGAVDCLQADVTRCEGITGFLRVAALCQARSLELSAHCGPAIHLHPCCAAPALRHLEYFHDHVRIEHRLFDGVAEPVDGALHPDLSRPGNGLELRRADAERYAH